MGKIESISLGIRHKAWREMYESYLSSGQTITEWCSENGVAKKTFYYRLLHIRKEVIETVESHDIVPITAVPELQTITDALTKIQSSGISIELPVEISSEVLTAAIRSLRS